MDTPLHLTFRDFPPSDALADVARARADKLDTMFDHVIACAVVIEAPHRSRQHGKHYRVRIDTTVPGDVLVVGRNPAENAAHEDAYVALEAAFDDAERMLQDYARQMRGEVKRHVSSPHARVAKLFAVEGYGFLSTQDGREIYFHKNSVLHDNFHRLRAGMFVRYAEEDGEKGPQASTVAVSHRQLRGALMNPSEPVAPPFAYTR
jgi:cold shock CspA family protein/ribosome-associated translation inhibitor RaiA